MKLFSSKSPKSRNKHERRAHTPEEINAAISTFRKKTFTDKKNRIKVETKERRKRRDGRKDARKDRMKVYAMNAQKRAEKEKKGTNTEMPRTNEQTLYKSNENRISRSGNICFAHERYIPEGVFGKGGKLISGKKPSLISKSKGRSLISHAGSRNITERKARKCSGIHPHCSICGRCHTNRRSHHRGHR